MKKIYYDVENDDLVLVVIFKDGKVYVTLSEESQALGYETTEDYLDDLGLVEIGDY